MNRCLALRAIVAVLLLGLPACDGGFLDEVPRDFVGPENFYRTAGDAIAAVNFAYATALAINTNWLVTVEFPTEAVMTRVTGGRNQSDGYQMTAQTGHIQDTWVGWYEGIAATNAVLENVPEMEIDPGLRDRIVGEAKFLRALMYFNLVRTFGGVPIWTNVVTAHDESKKPRATEAEVYALIVQDLEDAATHLPLSYSGTDIPRATRGAAQTLLAKVFLQRGATDAGDPSDYSNSADLLRDVISSGRYHLLADYAAVFDNVNEGNAEVIFDIQSIRAPGLHNGLTVSFSPPGWDVPSRRNAHYQAEYPFLESYHPSDERKSATWMLRFTNRDGTTVVYDTTKAVRDRYRQDGPAPLKFVDLTPGPAGETENNFTVLRYADVLLMLAEAINETNGGPNAEAYGAIDQVRARAGLPNLVPGLAYADFKDAVFLERRFELVMEMHGHWDSIRHWEWAKARIEAHMAMTFPGKVLVPRVNAAPIGDHFKLMPIPQDAIDLNPSLIQNPGY